ncbi:MAG TPA: hypothetical protein VJ553_02730 [Candidatus Paceibacterota bacterium]|nr:hypothetical protein [Candidatus Paceibacterota bacterium]
MDFEGRIRVIAESIGLQIREPGEIPPRERCWVDARVVCPYGSPEGQFIARPEAFCDTCRTYRHVVGPYIEGVIENESPTNLRALFKDAHTKIAGELRGDAEQLPEESGERMILELAADILEDKKLDRPVLLEDALPDE